MPTLFQLPIPRLSPLRRVPFWAQALALCALFAIAGVTVVDDYGATGDENTQRGIAQANADYIAAGNADRLYYRDYRYYGVAFEMPLLLAERPLGLQDKRHIYLMRHLVTHLLFIAGGFACGMLAYRTLGSRWVALMAMPLFLLHPRLYAHSFFNTKDIPFAALMVIALYLAHRAFRRDTIGAFLLCGIVVGLAIDLRPFALMLLPMILAMRGLDLWQAGREERKHILMTGAAFLAAALAMVYIIHPHYWENPLRFIESVRALSQHPTIVENLFMGEIYRADAVPWQFIPVWFAITAPTVALALGALGAAAVCWQGVSRPLAALRDREIRFGVMLLGCVVLPVAVVIALQSNIYNGWRQMYFLWGPFCLLAAVGLHRITNIRMGGGIWKIGARLPRWVWDGGRLHMARRALAYGVAGLGLITTLTSMAALHPHQQVYFNGLVDTKTPGALAERYDMDYWRIAQRQSLEYLLARYPDDMLRVYPKSASALVLPKNDIERIAFSPPNEADFYVRQRVNRWDEIEPPVFHDIRAYGSAIAFILEPGAADYRDYHRAAYDDVVANGALLARSAFDIYAYDGALYYLSANCAQPTPNAFDYRLLLHIFPTATDDLPRNRRDFGFENRGFWFTDQATFFDGKCVNRQPLPDYPIARIKTGHNTAVGGGDGWRADIDLVARAAAQAIYDRIAAGGYGLSAAQSHFDMYLRGNGLAYLKENCAAGDTDARFFLHIFPVDPSDLPARIRERGFENMDFRFGNHGGYAGDICASERELPDYPIAIIRTGQKATAPGGPEWRSDIDLATLAAALTLYDAIATGDYGQPAAQSDFDVYLRGNRLAYLKENCLAGDTDARFFLHIIPANPTDLPADRRESGFENRDFRFAESGARIGDKCVAERELPDYAIERIRTGQFVSGEGQLWSAEFGVGQ